MSDVVASDTNPIISAEAAVAIDPLTRAQKIDPITALQDGIGTFVSRNRFHFEMIFNTHYTFDVNDYRLFLKCFFLQFSPTLENEYRWSFISHV